MSTKNEDKNEFFTQTKDEEVDAEIDTSKVGKYKKRKTADIIVFPDIKNKKKISNNGPLNKKDINDLNNGKGV